MPSAASNARRRALIILGSIIAIAAIALAALSTFYTEILWFREVGFSEIFWTGIWVRVGLGVVFGLAFAAVLLLNLWIVKKITPPTRFFSLPDQVLERYRQVIQPYTRWVVIGGSLLFGLFAGSGAASQWRNWLLFSNRTDFGMVDPVFSLDMGFYVFRLPFHQFLFTWAFSALVVATLVSAGAHYIMGGIRATGERVAPEVRAHLSVLLGMILLLKAWGYRLGQFNLLYSDRGTVTGASYTDVNAQLPALRLLVVIAIITSVLFFINVRVKNWILPVAAIGLLGLTSIVAGGIYPALVQRFRVTPNEQSLEAPYIQRNIEATRAAYDISDVDVREFPAKSNLQASDIRKNSSTIENIRLWDPRVLVDQYRTLQRIKQYYEFPDVDIDRYNFDGGRRQVMLSAREVSTAGLPPEAQTWLNEHLVYTHGYGVVASRVDRVTPEGQPSFILQEIPPRGVEGAPQITEPQIYYGEQSTPSFVVANSKQAELDFPQGDSFAETRYDGTGGIELSSIVQRAAFAWRFRDVNLLISGAITPESRLLFRRNIMERVERVAPFLQFDSDPYIAIVDGRLVWIVDAYTTTDMFPYSQRINLGAVSEGSLLGGGNYVRNAAKFTVDAKNGTVTGYAWDEDDPVLATWMKVFPDALQPKSAMPDNVLEHVRYPEGLFKVQSNRYGPYHITDPVNFYSQEDVWNIGRDPTQQGVQAPPIPPYYVLQNLPGEKGLDFVLVRPFTPRGRSNLSAYLVAHSDPDQYGKLVAYRFPKSDVVFGPEQIQARINADPAVSQQVSLWNQQNSRVIYGNLLIVPIEEALLYVQPLYLQGQGSELPELKRVVAVVGQTIQMQDTLADALNAIFDGRPIEIDEEGEQQADLAELLRRAIEADRRAQDALRRGDFAEYGRQQQIMRQSLEEAARESGAEPSPEATPTDDG